MFKINSAGNYYYSGKFGRKRQHLPAEFMFIVNAFGNQKRRCYNKNGKDYDTYGLKGIQVEYSLRELIGWYQFKTDKDISKKVIGRIDHSKNYSLNNIRIETKSFSSKERISRAGCPRGDVKIKITNKKTNQQEVVVGIKNAANKLNLNNKTISRMIDGATKKPNHDYIFERIK